MRVTVDIGGLLQFLILDSALTHDEAEVIGLSRVAFLSSKDPGHVFLPAARWHDAAYSEGASIQGEWPRWKVDAEFLKKMLFIAEGDLELQRLALTLYFLVRKFGAKAWEGVPETFEPV